MHCATHCIQTADLSYFQKYWYLPTSSNVRAALVFMKSTLHHDTHLSIHNAKPVSFDGAVDHVAIVDQDATIELTYQVDDHVHVKYGLFLGFGRPHCLLSLSRGLSRAHLHQYEVIVVYLTSPDHDGVLCWK